MRAVTTHPAPSRITSEGSEIVIRPQAKLAVDLDGFLLDSLAIHTEIREAIFAQFGIPVIAANGRTPEDAVQQDWVTQAPNQTIERQRKAALDQLKSEYIRLATPVYRERAEEFLLFPDAEDFIERLEAARREIGISACIATNSRNFAIDPIDQRLNLRQRIGAILTRDMVDGNGKPHPALYKKAADLLEGEPDQILAAGDTMADVVSAYGAGYGNIALLNRSGDFPPEATNGPWRDGTYYISSLKQIQFAQAA